MATSLRGEGLSGRANKRKHFFAASLYLFTTQGIILKYIIDCFRDGAILGNPNMHLHSSLIRIDKIRLDLTFCRKERAMSMVLDVTSEVGALVRSKLRYLIRLRDLIRTRTAKTRVFFLQKDLIPASFLHNMF